MHTVHTVGGSPACSSALMALGTVFTSVTLLACPDLGNSKTSSTKTIVLPVDRGRKISKIERSKHTDVEASTPRSVSASKYFFAQARSATAFLCSTTTPFGLPVEPDV